MSKVVLVIERDYDYWRYGKMTRPLRAKKLFPKYYEFFGGVGESVKQWNLIFRIKWADFRRKLHEIASKTYLENHFDHIVFYSDEEYMSKMIKDEDIVVCRDEDDWIHPNLADMLRKVPMDAQIITWNRDKIEEDRGLRVFVDADENQFVHSAGYAMRGHHPKNVGKHWTIKKVDSDFHIDETLAAWVNGVSSVTSLMDYFFCSYKDIKTHIIQDINAPFNLHEDFRDQWDLYQDLLKELLESSRI